MTRRVEEQVARRLRAAGGIEVRGAHPGELALSVKGTEIPIHLEVKHRLDDSAVDHVTATGRPSSR